jgi:transcriptional regulator with XRE-family HTH domain
MEPGERLRKARLDAGLSVEQLAERIEKAASTVRAHENGQNGIKAPMAARYARALSVTPEWLLYGKVAGQRPEPSLDGIRSRTLPICHEVAAGLWLPADEVRDEPIGYYDAHFLKEYAAFQQWLEAVSGDSMDRMLPHGALIHVVDAVGMGYEPRNGDLVVVLRRRAGGAFLERSVKQVQIEAHGIELWPRSHNPRWSSPLSLTDGLAGGEDASVEIVGKVVQAYIDFRR